MQPLTELCPAYDVTRGRCELIDSHPAPHAMVTADAYMTWVDNDTKHWTHDSPPSWLVNLPWLPGHQPAIPQPDGPTVESANEDISEGPVYNLVGGDWDTTFTSGDPINEERLVLNMGPQHPSTHGVLRLVLELEGETVTDCRAVVGYLHTGFEKNVEYRTWTQSVTFLTRADYLSPLFNEAVYCLGVEKLLDAQVPARAQLIRVLMMELNRICSHWVWLATVGLELGAITVIARALRQHLGRPVGLQRQCVGSDRRVEVDKRPFRITDQDRQVAPRHHRGCLYDGEFVS